MMYEEDLKIGSRKGKCITPSIGGRKLQQSIPIFREYGRCINGQRGRVPAGRGVAGWINTSCLKTNTWCPTRSGQGSLAGRQPGRLSQGALRQREGLRRETRWQLHGLTGLAAES